MFTMNRWQLALAYIIYAWSWIGWILDTPFRLPHLWAVDRAGILTDEGRVPARWQREGV